MATGTKDEVGGKEIMDELYKMMIDELSEEIANINIKAAPFGSTIELKFNKENIHDLADYLKADENDIKEIIRRNVMKLGTELQEFIYSKTSNKN